MDDETVRVAERLAADLGVGVTSAVRAVTDAIDDLPEADALFIEHAARARLRQPQGPSADPR